MSVLKNIPGVVLEATALGLVLVAILVVSRMPSWRAPMPTAEIKPEKKRTAPSESPKRPTEKIAALKPAAPAKVEQALAQVKTGPEEQELPSPPQIKSPLPREVAPAVPSVVAQNNKPVRLPDMLPKPPAPKPALPAAPEPPPPPPPVVPPPVEPEIAPATHRPASSPSATPASPTYLPAPRPPLGPRALGAGLPTPPPSSQGATVQPKETDLQEDRRFVPAPPADDPEAIEEAPMPRSLFGMTPRDYPLGFTGRSSVLPREGQSSDHFVPIEDRWRIGFPEWDRYGKGHPRLDDYPYVKGHWWDPFNQNVLKGDYPIFGQHTFLNITATSLSLFEPRQVPTATTPFESTVNPNSERFFGNPNQFFFAQFFSLSLDLFHGDAAFKPVDWRVRITPVFNINTLSVSELAVVSPDVRDGTSRERTFATLQEWFVETKLADLGPDYDFVSVRAGSQPFVSDFRGFIFADTNRGIRLFGNRNSNREQFNLAVFAQLEKNTNSMLNTFDDRRQQVVIANYFIQDFIFPGYTTQFSVHYNHDEPTTKFDSNGFLVRPDPVGVFQPHTLDVVYLGWTGDGHINRLNINHALYWALGHDTLNPLANSAQEISAQMGALELSYDRDWVRFRGSVFWSSGDGDINNDRATGFDSILDHPNFAGGDFSYWQRQTIRLFGVNLVQRQSLVPDLRSSKFQGQSNFVNPGLTLLNTGVDFELTPRLRLINNVNFLWFDDTNSLRQFVFQDDIHRFIGTDLSIGCEYRPLLSNNVLVTFGASTLVPGQGFKDLFSDVDRRPSPLFAAFLDLVLTY